MRIILTVTDEARIARDEAQNAREEAQKRANVTQILAHNYETQLHEVRAEHLRSVGKLHVRGAMEMYEKSLGKTREETRSGFWQRILEEDPGLLQHFGPCLSAEQPTAREVARALVNLYATKSSSIHNTKSLVVVIHKELGPDTCLAQKICEACGLNFKICDDDGVVTQEHEEGEVEEEEEEEKEEDEPPPSKKQKTRKDKRQKTRNDKKRQEKTRKQKTTRRKTTKDKDNTGSINVQRSRI